MPTVRGAIPQRGPPPDFNIPENDDRNIAVLHKLRQIGLPLHLEGRQHEIDNDDIGTEHQSFLFGMNRV